MIFSRLTPGVSLTLLSVLLFRVNHIHAADGDSSASDNSGSQGGYSILNLPIPYVNEGLNLPGVEGHFQDLSTALKDFVRVAIEQYPIGDKNGAIHFNFNDPDAYNANQINKRIGFAKTTINATIKRLREDFRLYRQDPDTVFQNEKDKSAININDVATSEIDIQMAEAYLLELRNILDQIPYTRVSIPERFWGRPRDAVLPPKTRAQKDEREDKASDLGWGIVADQLESWYKEKYPNEGIEDFEVEDWINDTVWAYFRLAYSDDVNNYGGYKDEHGWVHWDHQPYKSYDIWTAVEFFVIQLVNNIFKYEEDDKKEKRPFLHLAAWAFNFQVNEETWSLGLDLDHYDDLEWGITDMGEAFALRLGFLENWRIRLQEDQVKIRQPWRKAVLDSMTSVEDALKAYIDAFETIKKALKAAGDDLIQLAVNFRNEMLKKQRSEGVARASNGDQLELEAEGDPEESPAIEEEYSESQASPQQILDTWSQIDKASVLPNVSEAGQGDDMELEDFQNGPL